MRFLAGVVVGSLGAVACAVAWAVAMSDREDIFNLDLPWVDIDTESPQGRSHFKALDPEHPLAERFLRRFGAYRHEMKGRHVPRA